MDSRPALAPILACRRACAACFVALLASLPASGQSSPPTAAAAPPARRALVVDEHGAPVAGAQVAVAPAVTGTDLDELTIDCESLFAAAERHRSRDDGVVELPLEAAAMAVMARAGDRFGVAWLAFDDRSVPMPILAIAPERHVHLRVRDGSGRPRAGVPVEVRAPANQWRAFRGWDRTLVEATDANGQLTLWHAQRLCAWDPASPRLAVRAHVVGADAAFVDIDLREARSDELELLCPPFGRLVVRRWLAPGIADGTSFDMHAWRLADDYDGARPDQAFGTSVPAVPGSWRSCPVALGQRWRLPDHGAVVDIAGPVGDGDEVVVDQFEAQPRPYSEARVAAAARFERPDGSPCAGVDVLLADLEWARASITHRVRTDERGRAWFAIRKPWRFEFVVAGENLVGSCAVPANASADGIVDLGVVRLRAPRLVATGRVVDATTRLPVNAELRGGGRSEALATAADGVFAWWHDAEGGRALPRSARVEVRALRAWPSGCFGYEAATHRLRLDGSAQQIGLERGSVLRATLLVDAHIGTECLSVDARGADGSGLVSGSTRARRGRIEHAWQLRAGGADGRPAVLTVAGGDGLPPLRTVPGSSFTPAEHGFDVEVDLRGQLAEFDLFTAGIEDMPFQGTWFVRHDAASPWRALPLHRHASVVAPKGAAVDAIVAAARRPWLRLSLTEGMTGCVPPSPCPVELTVQGVAVAGARLGAFVLLLEFADPEFGRIDPGSHVDPRLDREHAWPLDDAALAALWCEGCGVPLAAGRQRFDVPQRGRHVLVPYVQSDRGVRFLAAAAVVFATTDDVVPVLLRIDDKVVRAALEAK